MLLQGVIFTALVLTAESNASGSGRFRRTPLSKLLEPLKECQFVVTSLELQSSVHRRSQALQFVIHTLRYWRSPTFLLKDLRSYSRNYVTLRHSKTCIVHLTFPPVKLGALNLGYPFMRRDGMDKEIHDYHDLLYFLVDRTRRFRGFISPLSTSHCDHPLNFLVFQYEKLTVYGDPLGPSIDPQFCDGDGSCIIRWTTILNPRSQTSFEQILAHFRTSRLDFHGKQVYANTPFEFALIRYAKIRVRSSFLMRSDVSGVWPLVSLAEHLNISGFRRAPEESFEAIGLFCQVGLVNRAFLSEEAGKGFDRFTLAHYDSWTLWYGEELKQENPLGFSSLRQPLGVFVSGSVGISLCLAAATLLLTSQSLSIFSAAVYVVGHFLGQGPTLSLRRGRGSTSCNEAERSWGMQLSLVSFFVFAAYCAILQSNIVAPSVHISTKGLQELIDEGFQFCTMNSTIKLLRRLTDAASANKGGCAVFSNCNGSEVRRITLLLTLLKPVSPREAESPAFKSLSQRVYFGQTDKIRHQLSKYGTKIMGVNYYSAQEEFLHRPLWWNFHFMPNKDVVGEVFEWIQQVGIKQWAKSWGLRQQNSCQWCLKYGEEHKPFSMTDALMLEAMILYCIGMVVAFVVDLVEMTLEMDVNYIWMHYLP